MLHVTAGRLRYHCDSVLADVRLLTGARYADMLLRCCVVAKLPAGVNTCRLAGTLHTAASATGVSPTSACLSSCAWMRSRRHAARHASQTRCQSISLSPRQLTPRVSPMMSRKALSRTRQQLELCLAVVDKTVCFQLETFCSAPLNIHSPCLACPSPLPPSLPPSIAAVCFQS